MTSAGVWLLAARPKTLPAAATPVLVGTAVAWSLSAARWAPALAALFGALAIQVGTNFANDLFDFRKGADTLERLGPLRAMQAGLLHEQQMIAGIVAAFALATLAGIYLASVAGWPIVWIGVFSILSGLAYTGGPFPLAYNALGDLFVMVFFGFVAVCGTVYVQALSVPELAWWAGGLVGCLSTAILVVNNVRDIETDRKAGKKTIPVLLGRRFGLLEYALLLAGAYAIPVATLLKNLTRAPALACLLTLPLALLLLVRICRSVDGPTLNRLLAQTARFGLVHGLLFAAGLVIGGGAGP